MSNKQQKDILEDSLTEELVGFHSINPFIAHISSSRGVMLANHVSRSLVLNNGDEKIIQTGAEKQFAANTFSKKFENDSLIIDIVRKYDGISKDYADELVSYTIIFEDLKHDRLDYMEIVGYHVKHQEFGFRYKINDDTFGDLIPGEVVKAGSIVADSPAVAKNSGYKFGTNANVALISLPEVAEDPVVISESFAHKMNHTVYDFRSVEFGLDSFPLNVYGDDDNYKPFPNIGEYVNDESVIMAVREHDNMLSPAMLSVNDVKHYDPIYDKVIYARKPRGKIVDIRVHHAPRNRKAAYTKTTAGLDRYINGYNKYCEDINNVYTKYKKTHKQRYGNSAVPVLSNAMHKLITQVLQNLEIPPDRIKYTYRNEALDLYRVEFVIEYDMDLRVGSKVSDLSGSKGIVGAIWPDEDMPYDPVTGVRADVIMDPTSVVSRLNVSRLYEIYFSAVSRNTKRLVTEEVARLNGLENMTDTEVKKVFRIPLDVLAIIDTEQHQGYAKTNIHGMRTILKEILEEEFYIYYRLSSKKKPDKIVADMEASVYRPPLNKIMIKTGDKHKLSKEKVYIAPQYIILLSDVPDNYLTAPTAKVNIYRFPVSVGTREKHHASYKIAPVKTISETEARLYAAYVGPRFMAELKDRANSMETHKHIYQNILNAEKPTDIDIVASRDEMPYGSDPAIELVDNIFNSGGISIEYTDGK